MEVDEAVRLERGENVVELNVTRVSLTEEAVRLLGGDLQPPLFCTWDFYDFETQATPILRGIRYRTLTNTLTHSTVHSAYIEQVLGSLFRVHSTVTLLYLYLYGYIIEYTRMCRINILVMFKP